MYLKQTPKDSSTKTVQQIIDRNQYTVASKKNEMVIKQIVCSSVDCIIPNDELQLMLHYKNPTFKICRNKLLTEIEQSPLLSDLQNTNVICEYFCKTDYFEHLQISYISVTQTSLSRRPIMHTDSGAIEDHIQIRFNLPITREALVNNTKMFVLTLIPLAY